MEIVTGKRGFPHVSSYEMQTFQRGIISDGDVLLDVGDKLDYTIVDNNTIRILSGAILMQGIYCIIPYGTYDEMYIDSIEPGKVRKDVIYAQYNRDLETGMEEVIMDVKKGTEVNTGETPVQPSFPSPVTPLWEGGSFAYVKLYEVTVTYNAISVAEILDRSSVLLAPLQSVGQSVGDPVNLNTTNKTNVVSAVNEVNGKANANAVNIVTMLEDVSGLQGAVFSERKVYTERFATNVTGNGRLMLMVSTWKKDTACVNVRLSNRVTGGFTDVVLMIKQNSYYTKCKQMYNDGIGISKIYRGANNLTFDFEIPTSTNNAYDVYVTAPVWVSGTYETQTTLSGTEMTIDSFDYNEMESTVGNLNNLSTTTHANIVAAINEVNGKIVEIVESDYVITEYSVPYVSGSNTIFMVRSNDVAVVGDEEYLLTVEVIKSNGDAVEMLFRTTDDSVLNEDVFIFNKPQDSGYEAVPISKVEDATSFFQGNNADLWITLEETLDVTVRLTHHKSKTYTVLASPAMPSGTGRELTLYIGNYAVWSKASYNGQTGENVVKTNSGVSLITDGIDGDIGILNRGEGDSQFANVRIFTPEGDVRINNNYVGKTSLSGIGDGTITGAVAFSNDDGEEVSGEVITVTDAIDANAVDVSVDIEPVQEGSGTPSPTNVRPIHAVTETGGEPQIEIKRVGVNQWNEQWELGNIYSDTGQEASSTTTIRSIGYIELIPNESFYVKSAVNIGLRYYDKDYNYISGLTVQNAVATPPSNARYLRFIAVTTTYSNDISINYPSTDTQYHAYQGETYIIKTGQNIYGGTLDVTTGKMVVTHRFDEFDGSSDENWESAGTNTTGKYRMILRDSRFPTYSQLGISGYPIAITGKIISNQFVEGYLPKEPYQCVSSIMLHESVNLIQIYDDQYQTVANWKTYLASNPLQVVYELATPQTIQLTPQQIKMLKGTNTVSSNAQNINLTYLKDNTVGKAVSIVEKEIEPQIEEIQNELDTKLNADSIAPVENGATASTSYAVGSYIVRNNNLYKVISSIASGASFTNNNIQQTTVMAEILSRL